MRPLAFLLGLVALAACDKDATDATTDNPTDKPDTDTKAEPEKESEARKALVEAWEKAGLQAKDLKTAKAFGKDCKIGTVNGVEVAVCDQGSADAAKQAESQGLAWVGGTTGAAWTSGSLVIAVADRKKADAHGKTINQLMKATPKQN